MKTVNVQLSTSINDPVESALLYEKLYSKFFSKSIHDKIHEQYRECAVLGHRRYWRLFRCMIESQD